MIVSNMQNAYDTAKSAVAAGTNFPAAANKEVADKTDTTTASAVVTISAAAKQLSLAEQTKLANADTIGDLSPGLANGLNGLLASVGIKTDPPVTFVVDPYSAHVTVRGNRPDILQIEALVNGNEAIQRQIRDVAASSGHDTAMGAGAKLGAEYAAAGSQAGIAAVLAKYSSLLSGQQGFAANR